jgi:hypothetical protein
VWNRPRLERTFAGLPPAARQAPVFGIKLSSNVYWWTLLLLAAIGLLLLFFRGPLLTGLFTPPILIWAYFTAFHAATVIQDRYHFAAVPIIGMLAVVPFSRRQMGQHS